MAPVIHALLTQWPVLLAIVVVYLLNRKDIKLIEKLIEQKIDGINKRFDDVNKRIDDQKEDIKALGQKVDTLSGQVHRIEGHLGLPGVGAEA